MRFQTWASILVRVYFEDAVCLGVRATHWNVCVFPSRSIHSKSPFLFSCQARRKRTEFAVFKSGGSTDMILHLRELSRGSRISNELKMDGDVHSVVGALS